MTPHNDKQQSGALEDSQVRHPKISWASSLASALGVLLALGGCASPHHGRQLTDLQRQFLLGVGKDGIRFTDSKVLQLKLCDSGDCKMDVKVAAAVTQPLRNAYDCGIELVSADVILLGRNVNSLSWTLKPSEPSDNEYRFRPKRAGVDEQSAVYLYADTANAAFKVARTDSVVELTRVQRAQVGYAYGIYLDWRNKKGAGEWQACIGLDPFIIEHN